MAKTFIVLICILAPMTDLKVGDIQPAEILLFLAIPVVAAAILLAGFAIRAPAEITHLLKKYFLFLMALLALSIFAMRLQIYPPSDLSLLKTPPMLSIARSLQIVFAVGTMILLIICFINRPTLVRFFTRAYIYSGLLSAVYALVSLAALYGGVRLGGAYMSSDLYRARGFFVEGGPFGVYLVSVIAVVLFRRLALKDGYRLTMIVQLGILLLALLTASSNAGIILGLVLLSYFQLVNKKFKRLILIMLLLIPLVFVSGTFNRLVSYTQDFNRLSTVAAERSEDGALVLGRVMAAVLAPRMLADHPLAGIGFGNYSVQRNNPEYLQGLPTTDNWDLPGLGLAGYAVELGIPLFLILVWLLWRSVNIVRRRQVSSLVVLLASYQFFAHWLGVQITFVYPWIVTALALGYALREPLLIVPANRTVPAQGA